MLRGCTSLESLTRRRQYCSLRRRSRPHLNANSSANSADRQLQLHRGVAFELVADFGSASIPSPDVSWRYREIPCPEATAKIRLSLPNVFTPVDTFTPHPKTDPSRGRSGWNKGRDGTKYCRDLEMSPFEFLTQTDRSIRTRSICWDVNCGVLKIMSELGFSTEI